MLWSARGPLTSGSSSSVSPAGDPFPGFLSLSRRSRIRLLLSLGWDTSWCWGRGGGCQQTEV